MNPETQQAVIQKQALNIANLTLQSTVMEVELDQARARIAELEAALAGQVQPPAAGHEASGAGEDVLGDPERTV